MKRSSINLTELKVTLGIIGSQYLPNCLQRHYKFLIILLFSMSAINVFTISSSIIIYIIPIYYTLIMKIVNLILH